MIRYVDKHVLRRQCVLDSRYSNNPRVDNGVPQPRGVSHRQPPERETYVEIAVIWPFADDSERTRETPDQQFLATIKLALAGWNRQHGLATALYLDIVSNSTRIFRDPI